MLTDGGEVDNNEQHYEETVAAAANQNEGRGVKKYSESSREGSRRPKYVGRR